jgi:hypothetical protein
MPSFFAGGPPAGLGAEAAVVDADLVAGAVFFLLEEQAATATDKDKSPINLNARKFLIII